MVIAISSFVVSTLLLCKDWVINRLFSISTLAKLEDVSTKPAMSGLILKTPLWTEHREFRIFLVSFSEITSGIFSAAECVISMLGSIVSYSLRNTFDCCSNSA